MSRDSANLTSAANWANDGQDAYAHSMPFEPHPELTTPPDTTVLWRYMDFARFVQLIESQTLWFARADQLEDPLEATHTDAELHHLRSWVPPAGHVGRSLLEAYQGTTKMMRSTTYVNCWRAGAGESLAMWDLYGKGSGIVAVKSSVGLLKNELTSFGGSVHIAQIRYIDWGCAFWDNNALVMCARKDSSYQHESEVRAMIWEAESSNHPIFSKLVGNTNWDARGISDPPFGIEISVDVKNLITEVVVGPREQRWIAELVKRLLKRYELQSSITVSDRLTPRC
jgi:hypothetical protein